MTCYETLFVVKPTLTDEETVAQIAKIKDILAKEGAQLLGTNDMGMRKLAYPVQKNDRGYYTVLFYKSEGTVITELERNLKINEEVIKFLTVKYSNTKEMTQFNKLVAATNKPAPEKATPVKAEPAKVEEAPAAEAPAEVTATETAPVAESTQA
jgi:small subunit ribosomal protein S6